MANNVTFMEVPPSIEDPDVLRKFLLLLLQNLDKAFGNRGQTGFTTATQAIGISSAIANQAFSGQIFNNIKRYSQDFNLQNDRDLIDKGFLEANTTNNEEQLAITDITYAKANPSVLYTQAEAIIVDDGVDANTTKINEILTALRSANIIEV